MFFNPIRSFVKREGRMTPAQKQALETLSSRYVIPYAPGEKISLATLFENHSPLILEIGFGNGASLVQMAIENPKLNFIGIEVHRPGIGSCLNAIFKNQLTNLKIIIGDAAEILSKAWPEKTLTGIQIFFPDPWPKKRHHKRRLIQLHFIHDCYRMLKSDGWLHIATDWENYAGHIENIFAEQDEFEKIDSNTPMETKPSHRLITKFEKRGQALGHRIYDLLYRPCSQTTCVSSKIPDATLLAP